MLVICKACGAAMRRHTLQTGARRGLCSLQFDACLLLWLPMQVSLLTPWICSSAHELGNLHLWQRDPELESCPEVLVITCVMLRATTC